MESVSISRLLLRVAPPEYFEYGATLCSAFFFLSPLVQMWQVYRTRGAALATVNPNTMVLLFFNSALWLSWGIFLPMAAAVPGNLLGLTCGSGYLLFCWGYARARRGEFAAPAWGRRAFLATISAVALAGGLACYASLSADAASHVGQLAMGICVCMFAAPLSVLAQVLRDRSSEMLPPVQCFMQFMNCALWLEVGLHQSATPVIVSNLLGFVLATVQLALIAAFPSAKKVKAAG